MPAMTEEALSEYRKILVSAIKESAPDDNVGIALSGGIDSATVLFAMLEAGVTPKAAYTFYIEGNETNDLRSSRILSSHFGIDLVEIPLPWSPKMAVEDVRELLPHCHKLKKTIVQCLHPWKYMVKVIKEPTVFWGVGADDHFASQRKVAVLLRKEGEQAVRDAGWRKCYSSDLDFSAANIARYAKNMGGITLVDPYDRDDTTEWFLRWDIGQLHKQLNGKNLEKAVSVLAFADYFKQGSFYRKPARYNIESGLRDFHQALVHTEYNTRDMKDVIGIYHDIRDGII